MARRDNRADLIAGFLQRRKGEAEPPKKVKHKGRPKRRRVPPRMPAQGGGGGGGFGY